MADFAPIADLALGLLRLRFAGDDPALGAALRDTWSAFVVAPEPAPQLDVEVALRGVDRLPFASPMGVAARAEREGRVLLKLRGLALRIESAGKGTVRASALVERDRADSGLANLVRLLLFATAPAHAALLVHAAAVEHGDGVVLFLGAAHAGKSTVARLSAPRRVWTDDAVLLRRDGEALLGATVGLWGSEGSEGLVAERGRREGAVKALVAIRRGDENHLTRVTGAGAVVALLAACPLVRRDGPARLAALAAAEGMVRRVPVLDLEFSNRDGSFFSLLERAIEAAG